MNIPTLEDLQALLSEPHSIHAPSELVFYRENKTSEIAVDEHLPTLISLLSVTLYNSSGLPGKEIVKVFWRIIYYK